jgi:tetratricopeptide (TPR) repeat protein
VTESAHEPDAAAAFSDEMIVEEFIELPAEASPEPVVESPYWSAGPSDDAPRGVSADADSVDSLPGIASLGASVEDDDESFADDLEESDADDAMAASMSSSDPLIGRTPSFIPAVSEESSAAFVTETMAELYLQQGFYDEALSIYRQLLARNPADETLAERVRALEHGSASAVFDDESMPAHPSPDSESARAYFARFANRNPSRGGREGNALDRRGESAHAATVPLGGAAMPDEALTRPDEPTLTTIFSDRQVPSGDAQAARTLASAFGVSPDSMPARSGELSLQQLFRDVPARSSGAVTLGEQGTGSSQGSAGSAGASDPDAEAPADYEQFTAWLEGLKKK